MPGLGSEWPCWLVFAPKAAEVERDCGVLGQQRDRDRDFPSLLAPSSSALDFLTTRESRVLIKDFESLWKTRVCESKLSDS